VRRNWELAETKRGPCRHCGTTSHIELAHVAGREHDRKPAIRDPSVAAWTPRPSFRGGSVVWVHPDRVIPLCRGCHRAQHERRIDLLPLLSLAEQIQAIADLGGVEIARMRLAPSAYPERRAA
jgi:hypothetical protein